MAASGARPREPRAGSFTSIKVCAPDEGRLRFSSGAHADEQTSHTLSAWGGYRSAFNKALARVLKQR